MHPGGPPTLTAPAARASGRHQHSDAECEDTGFLEMRHQGGNQVLKPQCPSHCRSRAKHLGLAPLVTTAISSGHILSWLIKQSLWERQTEPHWSLSCAQAGDKPESFSTSEHRHQHPPAPWRSSRRIEVDIQLLNPRWQFPHKLQDV